MMFNKDGNGAKELRALTGNYYANNQFDKISNLVAEEEQRLADMIGSDTIKGMQTAYNNDPESMSSPEKDPAGYFARKAIALTATLRLYRTNDLSHEDNGRKFKIDADNEKLPWEWQLDRDDAIMRDEYFCALNSLLLRLPNSNYADTYKQTNRYKQSQNLLISDAKTLFEQAGLSEDYYLYFMMLPYLAEAQIEIEKNYGEGFAKLLTASDKSNSAYIEACRAEGLIALSIMLRRQQTGRTMSTVTEKAVLNSDVGAVPTKTQTDQCARNMMQDARYHIEEMKRYRDANDDLNYTHLQMPDNDEKNKYMRL